MPSPTAARLAALFFAATCSSADLAFASPAYPAAVAGALDLPCEPSCTLCHTRATGGFGTVNTPFGLSARMREGLMCCTPASVAEALDALEVAETDSDRDGTADIEELRALTDPNDGADVDLACMMAAEDDGGCSVARAAARRPSRASVLLVLAAVVAARVRRRLLA